MLIRPDFWDMPKLSLLFPGSGPKVVRRPAIADTLTANLQKPSSQGTWLADSHTI